MYRMFLLAGILLATPLFFVSAATPEQCAALHAINPTIPCDRTTRSTDVDNLILGLNQGVNAPHAFLKSRSTKGANISCLQPEFAKKAAAFVKAAEAAGMHPKIDDGYRGRAAQEAAKARGASKAGWCQSPHNYGLAIDMNQVPRAEWAWFRANASRYGLQPIGDWDPMHFQDAAGKYGQCGACANEAPDGALPSTGAPRSAPSSGVTNALRSLFNQPPQAPTTPPSTPQSGNMQPNRGTAGITDAYTPPPIVLPSTTTPTTTDPVVDTILATTPTTSTTSTPQNPLSPTTVITLAENRATLQPETSAVLPPTVSAPHYAPPGSTFGEGAFSSTDAAFVETHMLSSGFRAELARMQTLLETILLYLQPFSPTRYAPATPPVEQQFADDPAALFDDGFEFPDFE